jgi:NitT/TauT family transport system substrate-binding protein
MVAVPPMAMQREPPARPAATPPHRREWLIATMFAIAGSAAVLASLSGAVRGPERPLRIGANFWIGYEPLRHMPTVGDRSDVRIVEMRSTSAVLEGLRAGTLDGAAVTIDEAIRHSGPDLPLSIVLVLDQSNGADAVLARPGAPAVPPTGARIGVETEGVGALVMSRFLGSVGLTRRDVQVIDLPASGHDAAFVEGGLDYLVTYQPHVARLEAQGAMRIFDSRSIANEVIDVLVVRRQVLAARTRDVERLTSLWFDGLAAMHDEIARDPGALAKRLELPVEEIGVILDGLSYPNRDRNRQMMADGSLSGSIERITAWARGESIVTGTGWLEIGTARQERHR